MEKLSTDESKSLDKKKTSFVVRMFKRIFLFLFLALILLFGIGFIVGKYYQGEVKDFVITQINKQLNTEIIVDGKDIDFTVIENFPLASLKFKNIKALDALTSGKKDTLLSASKISLQFNCMDIFHKHYGIKKIDLNGARVKIKIDKNGNDNYHFWKTSANTDTFNFSFALQEIFLNNVQVIYTNKKLKQHIETEIKKGKLSGEFSTKKYSLKTNAEIYCSSFQLNKKEYLKGKNLSANFELNVDNELESYKIKDAKLKIEDMVFNIYGTILAANDENIINIGVKGKDLDIKSFLSLIPNENKQTIADYESEGEFYLDATLQGSFGDNQSPILVSDFGIRKGIIKQVNTKMMISNVNLQAHYSSGNKENGQPSKLTLNPFSATINSGLVKGELELYNLANPSFKGKMKANINLNDLQKFVKIDTVETINGQMTADVCFAGEAKNNAQNSYQSFTTSGFLELTDMNLKIKNKTLDFTNIKGNFQFDNNDIAVNSLTGKLGSNDFELKGFFRNIMNFVLKDNEDVNIEASLVSKNINLNELLTNKNEDERKTKGSNYKLRFSEHISATLNCDIANINFRKFTATTIKGVIKLMNKKLIADPIVLNTMDGNINTSGLLDGTDSTQLVVTCISDMSKINISKLFEQFENFGQTGITNKNIKGIATAKVQFASTLSPELRMNVDKIYASVDMTVENGELINVDAMKKLSRFIALEDLQNIRFSTLKNQIEIKNQVVSFPRMEVKSTAINLIASGTHTFKNDINYKIKLSLNELLAKKAKQNKKENDEFGTIADDGLGKTNIFLSMTGNLDKPIIIYDSKGAIQNVKQDIKAEKQTLKSILKEEFGLYKKDTTLGKAKTKQEDSKFKIQWEELEKKEEKNKTKKAKNEDDEDF